MVTQYAATIIVVPISIALGMRRRRFNSRFGSSTCSLNLSADATDREAALYRLAWAETIDRLSVRMLSRNGEALLDAFSHVEIEDANFPAIDAAEMKSVERNSLLRKLAAACRHRSPRIVRSEVDKTVGWLGDLLGLDELDRRIIAFLIRTEVFSEWRDLAEAVSYKARYFTPAVLSLFVGAPPNVIDQRLDLSAPICRAGLAKRDSDGEISAARFLVRIARAGARTKTQLWRTLLPRSVRSSLEWSDFDHLDPVRDIAEKLLTSDEGASILLYGPPGTGKTQFARLIASRIGAKAVFAGESSEEGREPDRSERLGHLLLLRALTQGRSGYVVVMDEADDVLCLDLEDRGSRSKLWLNNLVESGPNSTIWILNQPRLLEESIVRRMDLAIEFPRPTRAMREKIVRTHLGKHRLRLAEGTIKRLADLRSAPAIMASAIRGAKRAGGADAEVLAISEELISVTTGRSSIYRHQTDVYDASLSSADTDLEMLAANLKGGDRRNWSLLLSGPSGTGKSAYARHLAQHLGCELIEKRGSDLLDCYVGGTEQRLAEAFREAARSEAMLLIDEADDFLGDRTNASRWWERSMVNQMLRQLEDLRSPFVATTNHAAFLDPASRRRFSLRVTFQALDERRAFELFQRHFGMQLPVGFTPLVGQTPGDFAVVASRARLLGVTDPIRILRWLREEVEARGHVPAPIGF